MRGLLLDTNIWLWYVFESPALSNELRQKIDASAGDCWISPVSIWELGLLVERGRVRLDTNVRQWAEDALSEFPLQDAPLTREVALAVGEIDLPHRDPADHFLAATAVVYELTLVTTDTRLLGLDWLSTLS